MFSLQSYKSIISKELGNERWWINNELTFFSYSDRTLCLLECCGQTRSAQTRKSVKTLQKSSNQFASRATNSVFEDEANDWTFSKTRLPSFAVHASPADQNQLASHFYLVFPSKSLSSELLTFRLFLKVNKPNMIHLAAATFTL